MLTMKCDTHSGHELADDLFQFPATRRAFNLTSIHSTTEACRGGRTGQKKERLFGEVDCVRGYGRITAREAS